MSDKSQDQAHRDREASRRIVDLEARLKRVESLNRLAQRADEFIEQALRERLPLERTLGLLFPLLAEHLGATAAFVRTFDEDLEQRDFHWGSGAGGWATDEVEEICAAVSGGSRVDEPQLLTHALDVAGEPFGVAAARLGRRVGEMARAQLSALFDIWCEELDNHLAGVATSRRMHQASRALSHALSSAVLDDGVAMAIAELRRVVPFDDLVLVFHDEDDEAGRNLNYKVVRQGKMLYDSAAPGDEHAELSDWARQLLRGEVGVAAERFGLEHFRAEALVNGVKHRRLVGRVLISRGDGEFNTFDRDLLERFSDHLRQRIVDFNREYRQLSLCFAPSVVRRLLGEEDYATKFLKPQEREAAVLYSDIAGFTRISERVLREPALIGKLVDRWSRRVVQIIWETGDGVFDKMVGDCIIGLWGPPLFEIDAGEACRRAADAARQIRDFTRSLAEDAELPQLAGLEPPIGVATGLNYCPLLVGRIGPNEDYTGFSSGMNAAARLQGVATRDAILCMESFVEAHGDPSAFGEPRQAKAKNLDEPLRFRALL